MEVLLKWCVPAVTFGESAWAGDAGNRFSRFSQPLALNTLQHAAATLPYTLGGFERQPPRRRSPTLRSWSLSRVCAHARLRRSTASLCASRGVCSWRCPWCVSRFKSRRESVPACGAVELTPAQSEISSPFVTAGGPYFWSGAMAGKLGKFPPFIVGWMTLCVPADDPRSPWLPVLTPHFLPQHRLPWRRVQHCIAGHVSGHRDAPDLLLRL